SFFFFNDTAPTKLYTLSLHDALPILARRADARAAAPCGGRPRRARRTVAAGAAHRGLARRGGTARQRTERSAAAPLELTRCAARDRKSTRLNSSHDQISYAVFCLKKK